MAEDNTEDGNGDDDVPSHAERGAKGGRPPLATRDDVLAAVWDALADADAPVVKTEDVVGRLPIGAQATREHLGTLTVRGDVRSLKVGSGRVWWIDTDDELTA